MKLILTVAPLVAILATSCQKNTPKVATLPPVVQKKQVASKPSSSTKTKTKTRKYRSSSSSSTARKKKPVSTATATTISKPDPVDPLKADPVQITPLNEIPKFKVPENIQPKVTDGINQGLFIELKW